MPESFTVRRRNPELITPARPTPRETKPLSDLDDYPQLRYLLPCLEFFLPAVAIDGRPADAIKEALAEALVYYYPIAGRLREIPDGKLAVECTSEGVVFVEAEADVGMDDLGYGQGEPPMPPFRCAEEFLCDVGDVEVILEKPLFFMQITQLKGGGFVFGTHICHCISDGFGTLQFLKAIVDLARGEAKPTTLPIWEREMVMASQPPHINPVLKNILDELESDSCYDIMVTMPTEDMVCEYLTFSEIEMSALRNHIPMNLTKKVTSFELIISVIWRCRTMALGYKPSQIVRLMINVNARGRWSKLGAGYYGNAIVCPVIETTVNELCTGPIGHTIDLIRNAKQDMMSEENIQLLVDLMPLLRQKEFLTIRRIFETCDIKWIGQDALDLGWAKRIGGGMPNVAGKVSYQSMHKYAKGEKSVVVSMLLPQPAMDRFKKELDVWLMN